MVWASATAEIVATGAEFAGASVIVCGCGPSLNELPLPSPCPTIGVNDVGRRFDPDYLVVLNGPAQFTRERWRYVESSRAHAVFSQLPLRLRSARLVPIRLGERGGTRWDDPRGLPYARNSPYVAVCLALRMGARRIGLIGVDFTEGHFFGPTGPHPLARELPRIEEEYARLAAAARAAGAEILNVSSISRLTTLPRMPLGQFLRGDPVPQSPDRSLPGPTLRVSIAQRGGEALTAFLDALAGTMAVLGHQVDRTPHTHEGDARTVSVVWNGRSHRGRGPVIYCEHGWLPRSAFQVSPRGINADSHVAPFRWDGVPLNPEAAAALERHLSGLRSTAAAVPEGLPQRFLLVPLQMEYDTNIQRHAPAAIRTMQALVDRLSVADPPWPLLFKQHPADARRRNRHLALRLRRPLDAIWPHARGDIHSILRSGRCAGIVSINSNTLHDGLIWDVPGIALGRGPWPDTGMLPFLRSLPDDWGVLERHGAESDSRACRRAYASYLVGVQWSMDDARNPVRVARLLAEATGAGLPALARPLVARGPRLNLYARNRGWRFEELKRRFAARAAARGLALELSEQPSPRADAWLAMRAKELATVADRRRTVVQIHDLFDASAYHTGGERAAVAECGAVQLTHPDQQNILAEAGITFPAERMRCRPLGAAPDVVPRHTAEGPFTVAWLGRPEMHQGRERQRPEMFVAAMSALGPPARAVLAGERLAPQAAALRRAGIEVVLHDVRRRPLASWPSLYAEFDAVLITAEADPGPAPLFDALAAGVPVVSTRVGWAPQLLEEGRNGFLAENAPAMAAALWSVRADRAGWLARAESIRSSMAGARLEAWVDEGLDLALTLAGI
jgi:glycosyltransferase involved in cell wall biosynthesis